MKTIVLKIRNLSVPELVAKGRHFVKSMTGNSNFTTPNPTLADVTTATNDLDTVYSNAEDGGKKARLALTQKESAYVTLLTRLGNYVEFISQGDEAIILSAGMDVKRTKGASQIPVAPEALTTSTTGFAGVVELKCKSVKTAVSYLWEYKAAGATDWNYFDVNTRPRTEAINLVPGQRYEFRLCAVNASGKSPWCKPVSCIAA